MNSSSKAQSPNFSSVYRSTPAEALTRASGAGPPQAVGGTRLTASFLGSLGSSATRPTTHLLLAAGPRSFQPLRSLPLNGRTSLSAPEPGAASTAARPAAASAAAQVRDMTRLLVGRGTTRAHLIPAPAPRPARGGRAVRGA